MRVEDARQVPALVFDLAVGGELFLRIQRIANRAGRRIRHAEHLHDRSVLRREDAAGLVRDAVATMLDHLVVEVLRYLYFHWDTVSFIRSPARVLLLRRCFRYALPRSHLP